jgi:RNase P subunit RPR2
MIPEQNIIEDIFDIRNNSGNYDNEDLLNIISEMLDITKHDKYFVNNLETALHNKREELGFCPNCGKVLNYGHDYEIHTELDGNPKEEIGYSYCSNCGWTDKD